MNETTLGCQPAAGQRHLPQSFQNTAAGMEARAGQPILRAVAPQQDKLALPLLYRPAIPVHETRSPAQPGLDCVAAAPRFAPREAEPESESPPPRWLAKLSPDERDEKWLGAAGGLDQRLIQTMLASKLVDVNAKNEDGDTGLHLAIQEGDPDIIRLFLDSSRIDINARNARGHTALHLAVIDYAYESVFDLAGCNRTDVNAEDKEGWTALRWAARHGRESLVKVLLTAPAIAVNAVDARGWAALRHAAEGQHVKVVKMLLSHPCIRIHPRPQDDWNILQWAFDSDLCGLVLELIQSDGTGPELGKKKPRHVFLVAAEQGKTGMVRSLLALPGLDVNMVACEEIDGYGDFCALVLAAMHGHLETVQALLEAPEINVNFGYRRGGTALSWAAGNGHLPVVLRLLAEPGIFLANSHDTDYWDLLHWAVEEGHADVLRAALATRDAVDMLTRINDDNKTPLAHAVLNFPESSRIIELLLAATGIGEDEEGCGDALAWAAERNHLAATERLLTFACIANDVGVAGHALGVAADHGHMAIVHALLTVRGIDPNENYDEYSALETAIADDKVELASALAAYPTFDLLGARLKDAVEGRHFSLLRALLSGPGIATTIRHKAAWRVLVEALARNCQPEAMEAILDAGCDPIAMLDAAESADAADSMDSTDDQSSAARKDLATAAVDTLNRWLLQRASSPALPCPRLHATLRPADPVDVDNASAALIAGEHDIASLVLPAGLSSARQRTAAHLANATALGFALGHYRSLADQGALDGNVERLLKRKALWTLFVPAVQEFQALQDNIDRYCDDGQTMLTRAAQSGDPALMDVLVGLGARLNVPAADGDYPLMAAVKSRQWDAAIKLINLGARHALSDRHARSLAFHVCQGFAQVGGPQDADRAATLIEMLLDRDTAFDQLNPDPQSRMRYPTLADLLASNPQSFIYLATFQGTAIVSGANPARTERLVKAILDNTHRRGTQQADRQLGSGPAS